jgi:hypothetical protein
MRLQGIATDSRCFLCIPYGRRIDTSKSQKMEDKRINHLKG